METPSHVVLSSVVCVWLSCIEENKIGDEIKQLDPCKDSIKTNERQEPWYIDRGNENDLGSKRMKKVQWAI